MNKNLFEEEIVKEIVYDYEKLRSERRALELQWRLNMNYLSGNQYCEIAPNGDIEDYGKQYFWQSREVFNHIAPIIETRLAKLGRVKALVSVRPFSNDEGDIKAAKLSTQVLQAVNEENDINTLVNYATTWSEVCGSVFYKVIWDKTKGRVLGKNTKGETVKEGECDIIVCPPYEIFPDRLSVGSIEDCKYILHVKAYSVAEVKELYDVDVNGSNVDVFSLDGVINGGGLGYTASFIKPTVNSQNGQVVVIEKYEVPSVEFPNGRLIIVAGNKLVYYGELPGYGESQSRIGLPFARQIAIDSVGNFYGVSVIERIIPIQRAYNVIKNRKHEMLNRIAMGVLAVEDGSIDTDILEDEGISPGKIIIYRQGSTPPRMMDPGNIPNDFLQEEEALRQEFMAISGVSEFMRYTKLPQNISSGIAISMLQEQDDTRITTSAEHIRKAVKSIGQLILRLYKSYAVGKRMKRIAGDGGELKLIYFNASELGGDDLVFDTDNELMETPASRRNMVFELVRMGIMHEEDGKISKRNKVKILEMMGFGNWESARDIDECHRDKAIAENLPDNIASATAIQYDDHDMHILEHTRSLIVQKNDSKYIKNLLSHIKQHEMYKSMIVKEDNNDNRN